MSLPIKLQCSACKHLWTKKPPCCDAFPMGIPDEILSGEHDHNKPFKGDRGIRFEEVAEKGGPTSGWYAPPKGTHGPGSQGGKPAPQIAGGGDESAFVSQRASDWLAEGLRNGWREADRDERSAVKDALVTRISEESGVDYATVNRIVGQWSTESFDDDYQALCLQRAAQEEFGLPKCEGAEERIASIESTQFYRDIRVEIREQYERARAEGKLHHPDETFLEWAFYEYADPRYQLAEPEVQRKVLRTMYDITQREIAHLADEDGYVTLYRGDRRRYGGYPGFANRPNLEVGMEVEYIGNPLESWSVSRIACKPFASSFSGGQYFTHVGFVIAMRVPVASIIATAKTGFGCLKEGEFVTTGLRGSGKVVQVNWDERDREAFVSKDALEPVIIEGLGKGGEGSGWFAPPKGTHGEGSQGGAVVRDTLFLSESERKQVMDEGLYLRGDSGRLDPLSSRAGVLYVSDPSERGARVKTQAEHIADGPLGGRLLAFRVDRSKLTEFDPYNDENSRAIWDKVFPGVEYRVAVPYTDIPELVKEASKHGYNLYTVLEPSVQGTSLAITDSSALEVVREWRKSKRKGGEGSGWFAPPRGTHGEGSQGGLNSGGQPIPDAEIPTYDDNRPYDHHDVVGGMRDEEANVVLTRAAFEVVYSEPGRYGFIPAEDFGKFDEEMRREYRDDYARRFWFWQDTTAKPMKDKVCRNLSEKTGLFYEKVNIMMHSWAHTAADEDIEALEMQMAAADEFGLDTRFSLRVRYEYATTDPVLLPSDRGFTREEARKFLRASYDATQKALADAGYGPDDMITLYRGTSLGDSRERQGVAIGDSFDLSGNPLQSWSIYASTASGFAAANSSFGGGAVLAMKIPRRAIVSSAISGIGCLGEGEFIVLVGNKSGHTCTLLDIYRPWLKKGGEGSGWWAPPKGTHGLGSQGGDVDYTDLGYSWGKKPAPQPQEKPIVIKGGKYNVEKTGRFTWKLSSGVEVEAYATTSEEFGKYREFGGTRKVAGVIRVGGQEIEIRVDPYWEGHRQTRVTAQHRDEIIEQAIIQWLQTTPPEHLRDLNWIIFSDIREDWTGCYCTSWQPGTYGIMISSWQEYQKRGALSVLRSTLRHELGHHVWDHILTDAQRAAYAAFFGITVDNPEILTFKHKRVGEPLYEEFKALCERPLGKGRSVTSYGETNVFEDFADFYRGYNGLAREVDPAMDSWTFWDQLFPVHEFVEGAFNARLAIDNGSIRKVLELWQKS